MSLPDVVYVFIRCRFYGLIIFYLKLDPLREHMGPPVLSAWMSTACPTRVVAPLIDVADDRPVPISNMNCIGFEDINVPKTKI